MKIVNIDVKDKIIINNIEDIDTGELTGVSSKIVIPTGNYNNIILNFDFNNSKLCEDLKMFANFKILSGDSIDVALEKITVKEKEFKNACYIPSEVLEAECEFYLGLFGFDLNEDETLKQRVSFVPIKNSVVKGTYDPDAHEGAMPTPSVFEVYFQQVQDINEQIANEYQGIIDRLEEIKDEHIEDFNERAEVEKTKQLATVKEDIDAYTIEKIGEFNENASSYRKDINSNTLRIKRIETDIFDSGEASDSAINIKDSTLAEMQELSVDGTHKQDGTPTPDTPVEIEVIEEDFDVTSCGKNLFNGLEKGKGVYVSTGEIYSNIVYASSIDYIKVDFEKNPNYYLSGLSTDLRTFVSAYDKDFKYIGRTGANAVEYFLLNKDSFTANHTDGTIAYLLVSIYEHIEVPGKIDLIDNLEIMLNVGPTAIDYEPYQETKATFELPEGEFFGSISDTIKDEAKIVFNEEDGQYHKIIKKNIGKCGFDGSENWQNWSVSSVQPLVGFYLDEYINYNNSNGTDVRGMSNYFKVCANASSSAQGLGLRQTGDDIKRIYISMNNTIVSNFEEFKTWLSEHKPKLYYQLAEPYTIDLGIVDMPLTYYPLTNVFTTHDLLPVINVKYYRDIKNTITTMQTDIETLKQAVSTLAVSQTSLINDVDLLQEQVSESEVVE